MNELFVYQLIFIKITFLEGDIIPNSLLELFGYHHWLKCIQLHSTKTNYVKVIFVSIVFRIEFILVTILEYFRDKR